MARKNFNTFRFYLSSSIVLQAVLILLLVTVTVGRLAGVLEQGVHIMRTVQPTQMWTERLRADAVSTSDYLQRAISMGDEAYYTYTKSLWKREIAETTEKLDGFYDQWRFPRYRVLWDDLKFKLDALQEKQKVAWALSTPEEQVAYLKEEVLPLQRELNSQLLFFFEVVRDNASAQGDRLEAKIYAFFYTEGILYLFLVVTLLVIFRILNRKIRNMVRRVEEPVNVLSQGNLPEVREVPNDEFKGVLVHIHSLVYHLQGVKSFAMEVGKGNFDVELSAFNGEGEIGRSLAEMRESLQKVDELDKQRDWINSGFKKYGDLIRQYGNQLQGLTEELIRSLVEFLDANQGGFFVVEKDSDSEQDQLVLRSTYAYDRQKFDERSVAIGEGLLGQAWQEQELVVLESLPDQYLNITSGLGQATPKHLVLVPLITSNEVYGMFEIASFKPFPEHHITFLQGLAETVAAAINTVKVNDNTRRLLDDSQELTEQMRAQEEEMRQNMEELQATQEEMKRGADEAEAKVNRLNTILNSTADPVITVSSNGIIDAFNYAAEGLFGYNANEVIDHNIGILLPEEKVLRRELMDTSNSPVERSKVKTRRRMEAIRKGGKRFLAEVAVKDTFYDGQKYFTVLVRDVSNEIGKLDELTQSNNKLQLELEVAQAEKARVDRAQRETRMRHLALDRSVLLIDLKENGEVVYANELVQQALQLEEEALLGNSFKEILFTLDNAAAFDYFWKQVMATDEVMQQDLQFRGKDDHKVWTRCAFTKVQDEDGSVIKVLVIAQDISQQMQLLAQTQEEIQRLQAVQVDPAATGLDADTQKKLQELRRLQLEVQDNLVEVMQRNEGRMRDAIELQESTWKK